MAPPRRVVTLCNPGSYQGLLSVSRCVAICRSTARQIIGGVVAGLILVFVFDSTRTVKVRLIVPEVRVPLFVGLLIAALLGALITLLQWRRRGGTARCAAPGPRVRSCCVRQTQMVPGAERTGTILVRQIPRTFSACGPF
jgi:uncharacterized integral membrane protein